MDNAQVNIALRNTLLYNVTFIALGIVISVTVALLLFELTGKYIKIYQTIFYLPYYISWVVVAYVEDSSLCMSEMWFIQRMYTIEASALRNDRFRGAIPRVLNFYCTFSQQLIAVIPKSIYLTFQYHRLLKTLPTCQTHHPSSTPKPEW